MHFNLKIINNEVIMGFKKGFVRECKLIQPLWRTIWRFLKKLKIELPYDPAIPLLGIYPEKTIIQKDIYPNVHCNTIYNSQVMEAT